MNETEDAYPCVGVCLYDPDNGYCLGCGRPPLPLSMIGQGTGSEAANEETAIPHSASLAIHELPTNNAITKNSQEK